MSQPGTDADPVDPLHRDPASSTLFVVGRAGRAATAVFGDRLAAVGLRPHTFAVLLHLSREPTSTSAELARRLEVTPQSMGTLLHGLAGAGWVERTAGARRGQRIDVRLTDAGRAALHRTRPVLEHLSDPALLGLTPAEARTLHTLLDRVVSALGTPVADAGAPAAH
ncbi:MarR family transcriptional regulator [Modestobacter sp. I12A-02628]|uniref:Winged helix-turn-helix transcriptional regulator n=1 Tax=Goekera deserti TaxID=2497753 RepID=A0A7K3WC27_9ACTN|nr:MarR family winged helix-turn-helix transcriptional regulator [Goekera deserti]MPQ98444.1 MarR family transcriptional regulator [Goekera deserti]NDI48272.1 MarR family transcriptional regulator [Goekera deserti]NEL54021.1 winged helix-turn-helix transcriptional regulator [Goekera deserti]